jgi:peroxiredoxin
MLAAGERAPEFTLRDAAGGTHSLGEMLGRGPVLLAFFKVSCPVCQYAFPFLERIYQGSGAASGPVQIAGISQDDAQSTREFIAEFGVSFPVLFDAAGAGYPASNGFGIESVPSLFLIEPGGEIALSESGFSRRDLEAVGERAGAAPFQPGESVPELRPG